MDNYEFEHYGKNKCVSIQTVFRKHGSINKSLRSFKEDIQKSIKLTNVVCEIVLEFSQDSIQRTISLTFEKEIAMFEALHYSLRVEQIIMLYEGVFHVADNISFKGNIMDMEQQNKFEEECIARRPNLYISDSCFDSERDAYCGIENIVSIIGEKFDGFDTTIKDLDVLYSIILSTLSNTGIYPAVKCSFLIECAKSLYEYFVEKNPHMVDFCYDKSKSKEIPLRLCIDIMMNFFGQKVFCNQLRNMDSKRDFLSTAVHTRNRVMHINRDKKGKTFDGITAAQCYYKFYHVYRLALLSTVDSTWREYETKAVTAIDKFDKEYKLTNSV